MKFLVIESGVFRPTFSCAVPKKSFFRKPQSVEAFIEGFVNGLMSDQNRIYVNLA